MQRHCCTTASRPGRCVQRIRHGFLRGGDEYHINIPKNTQYQTNRTGTGFGPLHYRAWRERPLLNLSLGDASPPSPAFDARERVTAIQSHTFRVPTQPVGDSPNETVARCILHCPLGTYQNTRHHLFNTSTGTGQNMYPLYLGSDKGKGDAQRRRSFSVCYN